jgi:uncharacterized membrane protein YdjX (TVP38/TMEM64 family)
MAILTGPVFGPYMGFAVSHACSITGASFCYLISRRMGSELIEARFPDKL